MNDLIAWLTTNSTLMIRIGFTAILLLSVVYIYRHYFVLKTPIGGAKSASPDSTVADVNGTTEDEAEASGDLSKSAATSESSELREKLELLSKENTQLKSRMSEMQSELLSAQKKSEQVSEAPATEARSPEVSENNGSDKELGEMRRKIEQLESRLAEYEIIADDISEVGQLRQENADLKKQLASAGAPSSQPEKSEPSIEKEPVVEAENLAETPSEESELSSDQLLDEMLAESEANRAENVTTDSSATIETEEPVAASAQEMKLVSEKEVSKTEKELMTQFEETNRQKKGS